MTGNFDMVSFSFIYILTLSSEKITTTYHLALERLKTGNFFLSICLLSVFFLFIFREIIRLVVKFVVMMILVVVVHYNILRIPTSLVFSSIHTIVTQVSLEQFIELMLQNAESEREKRREMKRVEG